MKRHCSGSLFLLVVVALLIQSCDSNRVYEKNTPIASEEWYQDSSYFHNFTINDTLHAHNMFINIRNTGNYKYNNLLLFVTLSFPDNKTITDTLNCILADEKGKWHGKGWGSIWSSVIPYKTRIRFPITGQYSIMCSHAMRDEPLKAVTDIGIRIEKSE